MSGMRMVSDPGLNARGPCSRCRATGCHWDRLGEQPVCPDCQEMLLRGEGDPLSLPRQGHACAVCGLAGTVRYLTFPLHESEPVEIDLCPAHLRDFMGRRLSRRAFNKLRRQLRRLGLSVEQIFLLHESFYDDSGEALRPMTDIA